MSNTISLTFTSPPRTWAEVNLKNLLHNYGVAQQCHQGDIMAILKAGAYGHGMEQISQYLENIETSPPPVFFGVASVIEARRLVNSGIKTRIYLLGATCSFEREEIVINRWTPCISTLDEARHFHELAMKHQFQAPLKVHIAVDTGMGRGGFLPENVLENIQSIQNLSYIEIEGIGSHLPSADEDEVFTNEQFSQFSFIIEKLEEQPFQYRHLANSAGLLAYKSTHTNLFRPGLMLYGIAPIPSYQDQLKPVLSLKSRVTLVRSLPAGHGVSYGRDTVLKQETKVATIGIGYGDGYPRSLPAEQTYVLIRGKRCPLLGRVTMDQIMVDVSSLAECFEGDEVELFGENILVSEISDLAATIPWALLTGITPRVVRVYSES